ncbi:MAG: alpha-E domain-containing protein [Desulfobacterales bacterium]
MLSRVANSAYWMTRYIERAENIARFISVNLHLTLDFPAEKNRQWQPIIMATGDHQLLKKHTALIIHLKT